MSSVANSLIPQIRECAVCKTTEGTLLVCGKCKKVQYCGLQHQKEHWKTHKIYCHALAAITPPPKDTDLVPLLTDGRKVTQSDFKGLTGFNYLSQLHVSAEAVEKAYRARNADFFLYFKAKKAKQGLTVPLSPAKAKGDLKRQHERVEIKETPGRGHGLFAREDICAGTVICQMGSSKPVDLAREKRFYLSAQYSCCPNSAVRDYVGSGMFANEGFPNSVICALPEPQDGSALFAIADIRQGEEIYIDYGAGHDVKTGPYIVGPISYQRAVEYVETGALQKDIAALTSAAASQHGVATFGTMERAHHIFTALPLLASLILDGKMSSNEAIQSRLRLLRGKEKLAKKLPDTLRQEVQREIKKTLTTPCMPDQAAFERFCTNIQKINKAGPEAVQKTKAMMRNLTISAFVPVLPHLADDLSRISEYESLGRIVDHLYLITNGTLRGTYAGRPDMFPNMPFPKNEIVQLYRSLSPDLKERAKFFVQSYLAGSQRLDYNFAPNQPSPQSRLRELERAFKE